MPSIRVYERASAPEGSLQRFCDINQTGDVLRPGSVVCLSNSAADELLAVEREGTSAWRLEVRQTGWSAREYNGLPTYAHDYMVESMPVETLWLVVRNGGSIGFSSLAAAGRMLQATDSHTTPPALSARTPANWGASEAWERQRGEAGGMKLVSARWKDRPLHFTPLLCTCLPTAELARAEAFWGQQLFAVKEELKRQLEYASETESRSSELLKATQRQLAITTQRMEELDSRLQQQDDAAADRASMALDVQPCTSPRLQGENPAETAESTVWQEEHMLSQIGELQRKLAAAEEELQAIRQDKLAAVSAVRAELEVQLRAKDMENQRLLQDRHRLDVALFTIKNMTAALRQCSPTTNGDSQGHDNSATPGPAQLGVASQLADFEIQAEPSLSKPGSRHMQQPAVEAALHWLEERGEGALPPDLHMRQLVDEEQLMIRFRRNSASNTQRAESMAEAETVELAVGGCRLVNFNDSHLMDEAALDRILDAPLQSEHHQARVYQSLASCPASPAMAPEASPNSRSGVGGWAAGSLSLPSSAVKVLEPSAAIRDMERSSPGAADALAGLFADQLVVRASLQLPAKKLDAAHQLRHSAPAKQAFKPRSSFLQRSALPDIFCMD